MARSAVSGRPDRRLPDRHRRPPGTVALPDHYRAPLQRRQHRGDGKQWLVPSGEHISISSAGTGRSRPGSGAIKWGLTPPRALGSWPQLGLGQRAGSRRLPQPAGEAALSAGTSKIVTMLKCRYVADRGDAIAAAC